MPLDAVRRQAEREKQAGPPPTPHPRQHGAHIPPHLWNVHTPAHFSAPARLWSRGETVVPDVPDLWRGDLGRQRIRSVAARQRKQTWNTNMCSQLTSCPPANLRRAKGGTNISVEVSGCLGPRIDVSGSVLR